METKINFSELPKETKVAIFYSIANDLSENENTRIYIIAFFLKIHKMAVRPFLKRDNREKIVCNLKLLRIPENDIEKFAHEMKLAGEIKEGINYSSPSKYDVEMAEIILKLEMKKSKKNRLSSTFHLYMNGRLEDANRERELFFGFVHKCMMALHKEGKKEYFQYFSRRLMA
jgi:hypothetical protein